MPAYVAEFLGTALLILLGNGVVANVVLSRTKGHGGGWIVITAGWGFAVYVAVLCSTQFSGAHLNPAVTLGLALAGEFGWPQVPGYVAAQLLGAFAGACLVWTCYKDHYDTTDDPDAKLGTFCTAPAVRSPLRNALCEAVGTAVLVAAAILAADPSFELPGVEEDTPSKVEVGLGSLGALPVALVVFSIGLSLGGPTGYAINPARDFAPRIAHALLPIPGKRDSDWSYAPIPALAPLLGAAAVGIAARLLIEARLL
jgi:glycerol uptake facilitator protein